ncbi:MAG TPA: hypothetical protein VLY23_18240 [Candidatus Acidoferrum sp.]|nr:hypothetical protein [Candidatus Acidoferrum sp.]
MNLKVAGGVLLCAFVGFDATIRFRLKSIGYKWAFLRGGALDYREYLKVRALHGWSAWPVYLLWGTLIVGLPLFLIGLLSR